MVSFTKEMLVSDIILRVTKGKPSDDLELEPKQVEFWIDQILPGLMQQLLNMKIANSSSIDPSYIKVEDCIKPKIKVLGCKDCQDNIYIELSCIPVDLHRDSGVIRIVTSDGAYVDKVSLKELDVIRNLRFGRPSLKNLKYHRIKDKIYLHGLTDNTMHLAEFMVYYVPTQTVSNLDDQDVIYIGDELLPLLATELENIARRQIYQSDIDESNNGRQDLKIQ